MRGAGMKDVSESYVIPKGFSPNRDVIEKLKKFLENFKTFEEKNELRLLLLCDKRSKAFYLNCHIDSKIVSSRSDLDAVLDPTESEDYKLIT
mgnify:CR=1 FL=1